MQDRVAMLDRSLSKRGEWIWREAEKKDGCDIRLFTLKVVRFGTGFMSPGWSDF